MAKEVILDLATSKTWKQRVAKVIDLVLPLNVQEEIRRCDPEWIFADTFDYVIQAFAKTGEEVGLAELNYRLEHYFEKTFTHWRAYHACRPRCFDTYKERGILPLTREFVINEALELFRGHASEERIRKVASEIDLETREGDICLFADPFSPLECGQSHYLRSGSEIMQVIACHIPAPNCGILASWGQPTIVQCKIPFCDLQAGLKLEGLRELVTRYFQHSMSKGEIGIEVLDHSLRTSKVIPPENIEKFIVIDQAEIDEDFQMDH